MLCARVACSVAGDRESALGTLARYTEYAVRTIRSAVPVQELPREADDMRGLVDAAVIVGNPEEVAATLSDVRDRGVSRVVAPLVGDARHQLEQLARAITLLD